MSLNGQVVAGLRSFGFSLLAGNDELALPGRMEAAKIRPPDRSGSQSCSGECRKATGRFWVALEEVLGCQGNPVRLPAMDFVRCRNTRVRSS